MLAVERAPLSRLLEGLERRRHPCASQSAGPSGSRTTAPTLPSSMTAADALAKVRCGVPAA